MKNILILILLFVSSFGFSQNANTPTTGGGTADGTETIITGGTNVTVTGTGASGTPYVINAAGSGNVTINTVAAQTPLTNPPAAPAEGDEFLNTTDNLSWVFDGTAWMPYPVLAYRIGKRVELITGLSGDSIRVVCDSLIASDNSFSISCDTLFIARNGRYWYVSNNGNNFDAEKGNISKPCRDMWAARDSAVAGDLIYVLKGEYTYGGTGTGSELEFDGTNKNLSSLWKNGITYYLDPDVRIICKNWIEATQRGINLPLLYHIGTVPETCNLYGFGEITTERGLPEFAAYSESIFPQNDFASALAWIDNDEANMNFECKSIDVGDYGFFMLNINNISIKASTVSKGSRIFIQNNGIANLVNFQFDNVSDKLDKNINLIKRSYPGITDTSFGRAFIYYNSPNPRSSLQIGNAKINVQDRGLIDAQGIGGVNTVNVNNLELVDVVKKYNPNTSATGTWTPAGIPVGGSTVTVAGVTYTFVSTLSGSANEVKIDGIANSVRNLAWAINNVIGQHGVTIGPTVINTLVRARWFSPANVLTVTAIDGGVTGNSITLSASAGTTSGATLAGGLNDNANSSIGGGIWYRGNPTNTQSGSITINIENLLSDSRLVTSLDRNFNSTKIRTNIKQGIANSSNPLVNFTTTGTPAGTSAEYVFNCNLRQLGTGAIFTFNGLGQIPTETMKFEITGNYISSSTTQSIISNLRTDAVNEIVLHQFKGVVGFTELITGTVAQNYRTIYSSSNKAVGVNVTNTISPLLINSLIN